MKPGWLSDKNVRREYNNLTASPDPDGLAGTNFVITF